MNLFGKRISQLESDDIQRLVFNQVKEHKGLDYKRELKLDEKDKREFLFDITSMFNTDGGCIIYGIEELKDEKKQNTGIPKDVVGIIIENEDKLFQRIEDIIRSNTEPSINNLDINHITVNELDVLIIGIPKGLGMPCMVTLNGTNKFYKRKNSGKYAVDVYELNQMFLRNMIIKYKIEKFRIERLKLASDGTIFPKIDNSSAFFTHIFPLSFANDQIIDLSSMSSSSDVKLTMKPLFSSGWDYMYNYEGFATYSFGNRYDIDSESSMNIVSYNQLFRNGIYEIFSSRLIEHFESGAHLNEQKLLDVIEQIQAGLKILNLMEIDSPFYLSLSFCGLLNGRFVYNGNSLSSNRFLTNEIILPSILMPSYDTDLKLLLSPVFDIVYQAVGINKSKI